MSDSRAVPADEIHRKIDIACNHCAWCDLDFQDNTEQLSAALKRAWTIGLEHAWEQKGHVVETFVDGRLKATQQIAEMNAWKDHRSLVVEEGVD